MTAQLESLSPSILETLRLRPTVFATVPYSVAWRYSCLSRGLLVSHYPHAGESKTLVELYPQGEKASAHYVIPRGMCCRCIWVLHGGRRQSDGMEWRCCFAESSSCNQTTLSSQKSRKTEAYHLASACKSFLQPAAYCMRTFLMMLVTRVTQPFPHVYF